MNDWALRRAATRLDSFRYMDAVILSVTAACVACFGLDIQDLPREVHVAIACVVGVCFYAISLRSLRK